MRLTSTIVSPGSSDGGVTQCSASPAAPSVATANVPLKRHAARPSARTADAALAFRPATGTRSSVAPSVGPDAGVMRWTSCVDALYR